MGRLGQAVLPLVSGRGRRSHSPRTRQARLSLPGLFFGGWSAAVKGGCHTGAEPRQKARKAVSGYVAGGTGLLRNLRRFSGSCSCNAGCRQIYHTNVVGFLGFCVATKFVFVSAGRPRAETGWGLSLLGLPADPADLHDRAAARAAFAFPGGLQLAAEPCFP